MAEVKRFPAPDWRVKDQRLRMIGDTCLTCGKPCFPPKDFCPTCSNSLARLRFNLDLQKGTVEFNPEVIEGTGLVGAFIHLLRRGLRSLDSGLAKLQNSRLSLSMGLNLSKLFPPPPHKS